MSEAVDFQDVDSICRLVRDLYGLETSVSQLPGEIDLNFRIRSLTTSEQWCLKVSHVGESREHLMMQQEAMEHLHRSATGLHLPRVVRNVHGEGLAEVADAAGGMRLVRMLNWVDGTVFADVRPQSADLLRQFGTCCGKLSRGLSGLQLPSAHRFIKWDPQHWEWVIPHAESFPGERLETVRHFITLCSDRIAPLRTALRSGVNYNDANDYNVLVSGASSAPVVSGVIDFGDLVHTWTVNELAIGLAYAVMHKPDPVEAICRIVEGYHLEYPLTDAEIAAVYPLMVARLLISVTCSELNRREYPENSYLQVSDAPAWELLSKLRFRSPDFIHYSIRAACGLEPAPASANTLHSLKSSGHFLRMPIDLPESVSWLDLGIANPELGCMTDIQDASILNERISTLVSRSGGYALGRYGETRAIYRSNAFCSAGNEGPVWRSVHLGVDFFCASGTAVHAVADGIVHSVADHDVAGDYGPTVILYHTAGGANPMPFYSLYGHLGRDSIRRIKAGDLVSSGQVIGAVGSFPENGNWAPHLHLQFMTDLLGNTDNFPGVCARGEWNVWSSICPDPWQLLTGTGCPVQQELTAADIVSFRRQHVAKNLSISYKSPLVILRGDRQFLIDHTGRRFLDTVNNVAHVGHEHPRVVRAGQNQMAVLNTNTRYLHPHMVRFTEAFLATLPAPLEVLFFVNSGSEANELAIRLARTYTAQRDMIVSQVGYHGNTNACVEVSSYKFDGPGGKGAADHIHVVPIPDGYRGLYRYPDSEVGMKYAAHVGGAISKIRQSDRGVAAFLFESVISCGGQVELPAGFLRESYRMVRAAGGLCIADEVQTGCGRAGDHYWAFEAHGVVPDILTVGKPIGNGHPLGIVATTQEVAEAFRNGMEYFNTFGGNPVSCAIGKEVLDVVREEGLQEHARVTGNYLKAGLHALAKEHSIIGDVRGTGLFLGFELVTNPDTRIPATAQASWLANRMRDRGILMSTDGPFNNVLKIKPPMVFSRTDADFLLENIALILQEDVMRVD